MSENIRTLPQRLETWPVYYIEGTPAALVSSAWLDNLWEHAVANGYRDPLCTTAGQDTGFMPHNHFELDEAQALVARLQVREGYESTLVTFTLECGE